MPEPEKEWMVKCKLCETTIVDSIFVKRAIRKRSSFPLKALKKLHGKMNKKLKKAKADNDPVEILIVQRIGIHFTMAHAKTAKAAIKDGTIIERGLKINPKLRTKYKVNLEVQS